MAVPIRFRLPGRLAAVALWLAGCAPVVEPEAPHVTMAAVRPVAVSLWQQKFDVDLRVTNPNGFALVFDGVTAALAVNALPFAHGSGAGRFEIPAAGDDIVTVSVTTSLEQILPRVMALPRTGRLDYTMAGYTVVELYGRHRVAFDETGTLDAAGPFAAALEMIGRLHNALTGRQRSSDPSS